MSRIFLTGLSYVNMSGAGGSVNVSISSPTGLTINRSEEVFVPRATSNRISVLATNSYTRDNTNDLLLGGQNNGTFVSNLGTDTLTRGTNPRLSLGTTTNSASGRSNVIADLNPSFGDVSGIQTNNNLLSNFGFTGFNSIGDSFM
ncbi:hypothetical protein NIES4072_19160 [Nostoc commune NIES-4072]|uniref:Uncharacterized protein n=1 Tax=Nostoc commune NIES-4072 TaxID=2005467 RepID=A0A2R5FHU8_NOSCO|nr:hypothetical protein [Nostoc commune]BBD64421.1 hypothetical protein NIES4070_07640 [Nostoc commune HK-02]GBG18252.1 hypothetical protein NIES4072_19160 [Nostoc commune NIES-4072]